MRNNMLDGVDDLCCPSPINSTTKWGKYDEALIYDWYGAIDTILCFVFGILIRLMDTEDNMGNDVRIAPPMLGEIYMRSSFDFNSIWSEVIKAFSMR